MPNFGLPLSSLIFSTRQICTPTLVPALSQWTSVSAAAYIVHIHFCKQSKIYYVNTSYNKIKPCLNQSCFIALTFFKAKSSSLPILARLDSSNEADISLEDFVNVLIEMNEWFQLKFKFYEKKFAKSQNEYQSKIFFWSRTSSRRVPHHNTFSFRI